VTEKGAHAGVIIPCGWRSQVGTCGQPVMVGIFSDWPPFSAD
jgi:hypothetical protein